MSNPAALACGFVHLMVKTKSFGGQFITKVHRPVVMPLGNTARNSLRRVVNGKDRLKSVSHMKRKLHRKWQSCWSDAHIVRLMWYFHSRLERVLDNCSGYTVLGVKISNRHFGASVLKTRPTGQGSMPKRLEIWLFQGGSIGEID